MRYGASYTTVEDMSRMTHCTNWYCIYTKPNQEDTVCRRLGELPGIELLNPKLKRKKIVRKKLVDVVEELFPCYIFSRFDLSQYSQLITYTRGVKHFVGDRYGAPYVVDESIIKCITSKMTNGIIQYDPPKLDHGDRVVITNGPFSGFTGLFLSELKASERVMILLDAITLQARVEIPMAFIAKS